MGCVGACRRELLAAARLLTLPDEHAAEAVGDVPDLRGMGRSHHVKGE